MKNIKKTQVSIYTADYPTMKSHIFKIHSILLTLFTIAILSSCLSNYMTTSSDKMKLMNIVSSNETVALTAILDIPTPVIYAGAERVLHVDNVSFIRFKKSHKRGRPYIFNASKKFYKDNTAGVLVAVVHKGKSYKNVGIIYIQPRGNKTEVKAYSNNTYKTLFATTSKGLLQALERTLSLAANTIIPIEK